MKRHALLGTAAGLAATLAVTWIFRQTELDRVIVSTDGELTIDRCGIPRRLEILRRVRDAG